MRPAFWLMTVLALGSAGSACAQDVSQVAGALAAGVEGFGQSIGEAEKSGSSIFVTATGRVELPAPVAEAYFVNIEGRSSSAVEAYKLREDRLRTATALAKKFNVGMDIGSTNFSREVDSAAQNKRIQAERAAHPGVVITDFGPQDSERVFVASTGVRFRSAQSADLPAFLDALKAAGVDSVSGTLGAPAVNPFARSIEMLGFGNLTKIDDALWDRADEDAIAAARRQAQVLATAAGRNLGEVKQILFLTRSVQGAVATVTIAVRFDFAPTR